MAAVGQPVPRRRQERARALCLRRLVIELHALGVTQLCMEARADELNARDVHTVATARLSLPRGSQVRIAHTPGQLEPALWLPDLVAGAIGAQYRNDPSGIALVDHVHQIEVAC